MTPEQKRQWLRSRLQRGPLLAAAGVFDPLSARLVERCGFEAAYASGGAIARSLGFPDLGLVTLSEVAEVLRRICRATSLPVVADADTGYGGPLNVRRTVLEWQEAGVAALHLEDQALPKRCGQYAGLALVAPEEMVARVRAAVDASHGVVVIARTDARVVEGFEAAVRRATAYAEAGAEALFVQGLCSLEEVAAAARQLPRPLVVNVPPGVRWRPQELERTGCRLAIYPAELQRAAIAAMRRAAGQLRERGFVEGVELASGEERDALVDTEAWQSLAGRYRGAG
jgi:2-methylisocitrate lyase-like PEP mutase family enzyme